MTWTPGKRRLRSLQKLASNSTRKSRPGAMPRAEGSLPAQILEEVFHSGKKASGFRMRLCRGQRFEFGEKFALPPGEALRRFNCHLDIKIAGVARSQHRHALVFQFELFARLSA